MIRAIYDFVAGRQYDSHATPALREAYALTTMLAFAAVAFFAPLLFFLGDVPGAVVLLLLMIAYFSMPFALRWSGSLRFVWHALSACNFAVLAFFSIYQDQRSR